MRGWLLLVLFAVSASWVGSKSTYSFRDADKQKEWTCGIGKWSGRISFLLSMFSKTDAINQCCREHDLLLTETNLLRQEVDRVFCDCLTDLDTIYTKYIVSPIFCNAVKLFTMFYPKYR